jgi:hypothetical protein
MYLVTKRAFTIFRVKTNIMRHFLTYLLNYLLTPWSTVLLEKLTGLHLIKIFPTFYGTRRFVTAFTSDHQLSLS